MSRASTPGSNERNNILKTSADEEAAGAGGLASLSWPGIRTEKRNSTVPFFLDISRRHERGRRALLSLAIPGSSLSSFELPKPAFVRFCSLSTWSAIKHPYCRWNSSKVLNSMFLPSRAHTSHCLLDLFPFLRSILRAFVLRTENERRTVGMCQYLLRPRKNSCFSALRPFTW